MLHLWTWRVSFSSGAPLIRNYTVTAFTRIEAYDRALDMALGDNAGNILRCDLIYTNLDEKNGK